MKILINIRAHKIYYKKKIRPLRNNLFYFADILNKLNSHDYPIIISTENGYYEY